MVEEPAVEELLRSAHRSVENGDFAKSDELCRRAYERLTSGLGVDYFETDAAKLSEQDLQNVMDCSALVVSQIQRLDVSQPEYRACLRMLAKLCERSGKIEESKVLHIRSNELDRKYVMAQLFVEPFEKMTYLNLSTILDLGIPGDIAPAGEDGPLKPEHLDIQPDLGILDVPEPEFDVPKRGAPSPDPLAAISHSDHRPPSPDPLAAISHSEHQPPSPDPLAAISHSDHRQTLVATTGQPIPPPLPQSSPASIQPVPPPLPDSSPASSQPVPPPLPDSGPAPSQPVPPPLPDSGPAPSQPVPPPLPDSGPAPSQPVPPPQPPIRHPVSEAVPPVEQSFAPGAETTSQTVTAQTSGQQPEPPRRPPSPETVIFISAAKSAFQSGDFEEAIRCYRVVLQQLKQDGLEEDEDAIDAHLAKGAGHVALGEHSHAITEYSHLAVLLEKRLGQTHPYCIAHLHRLSKTLEKAGRLSEAQTIIERAAKLAENYLPANDELRIRVAEVNDAMRKMHQQSLRESIDHADKLTLRDMVSDEVVRKQVLDRPDQLRNISWFLCTLMIVAAAILWWPMISDGLRLNRHDVVTRAESTKPVLPGQVFRTSDDTSLLSIVNDDFCLLTVDGSDRKIRYVVLRNDWTDIGQMLVDASIGRKIWIQRVSSGLMVDDGHLLFRSDAPELKIVSEMRRVGQQVQEHYQKFRTYPQNEEEWAKLDWTTYINPATGKPEQPRFQIFSRFARNEDIFGGATTDDGIREFLIHGGVWSNESNPAPFRIDCASRCSMERRGRTYAAPYFFLHGRDRTGALIAGQAPGTNLMLLLHDGENLGNLVLSKPLELRTPDFKAAAELSDSIVYISNETPLLFGLIPLKYLINCIGIIVLALLLGVGLHIAVRHSGTKAGR